MVRARVEPGRRLEVQPDVMARTMDTKQRLLKMARQNGRERRRDALFTAMEPAPEGNAQNPRPGTYVAVVYQQG